MLSFPLTEEDIRPLIDSQLEACGVEYFDYYLLHNLQRQSQWDDFYVAQGVYDYLLEEKKAGRIRRLGFSFHGDVKTFDYALTQHDKYRWDFVQIQMNYVDWLHAKEVNPANTNAEYLYAELEKRGIPNLIMEPLLGGRLSNVPDHIATRLKEQEPTKSVASWSFRFNGSYPNVLSVLSGMTYMEHLQDNIRTYAPLVELTQEQKQFLFETAELMLQYPTIPCNDCKYCMPCPYGLDIPAILLHYNKCINEGMMPTSSQDPIYKEARQAFLVGYDRSVPKLRQADHCIGCRKCERACPQHLPIREYLKDVSARFE